MDFLEGIDVLNWHDDAGLDALGVDDDSPWEEPELTDKKYHDNNNFLDGLGNDPLSDLLLNGDDEIKQLFAQKPPAPKKNKIIPSEQQLAIYEELKNRDSGHITIIARAGSSKTTTSIEGSKYCPENSVMFAAFGKAIAKELEGRLPDYRCKAKTIHSMGMSLIRERIHNIKVDKNVSYSVISDCISKFFLKPENRRDTESLVYCRDNMWKIANILQLVKIMAPYATDRIEIYNIAASMGLGSSPARASEDYDGTPLTPFIFHICDIVNDVLHAQFVNATILESDKNRSKQLSIDFSDMLWLPVRMGWTYPKYEIIFIDEAQDLSFTQIELATQMCKGRIVLVGDDLQAIYAWRGADSDCLSRMTEQLGSKIMKLTTCYRCAKNIIKEAQKYCSDIQAWDQSPDGLVERINYGRMFEMASDGDFILSRANAPLMAICLRLIAKGKRAMMAGANIGAQMIKIYEEVEGPRNQKRPFKDMEDMWDRLIEWGIKESNGIKEAVRRKYVSAPEEKILREIETQVEQIRDKIAMFNIMLKHYREPKKVLEQLKVLFEKDDNDEKVDRSRYILCSSIHRAKGLETKTAFVIASTLKKTTQEEVNICYVAVTRAKENLYYVYESGEDMGDDLSEYRPELNQE